MRTWGGHLASLTALAAAAFVQMPDDVRAQDSVVPIPVGKPYPVCIAPSNSGKRQAHVIMDPVSGEVLCGYNIASEIIPASITKIMTLMVAIEAIKAGDISYDSTITISELAARQPASKSPLKAGETLSLREAMLFVGVKSANDITVAVAESVAGSEEAFVRRMNELAGRIGPLNQTHFINTNGLWNNAATINDSPRRHNYTTAENIGHAMAYFATTYPDEFYEFLAAPSVDILGKTYHNSGRKILASGAYATKTGYLRLTGFSAAAFIKNAEENPRVIVIIGEGKAAQRDGNIGTLIIAYSDLSDIHPVPRPAYAEKFETANLTPP